MLEYFSVENFGSFKDKVEFDFKLNSKKPHNSFVIFGANASGKTTFLEALTFVFWFIQKSFGSELIRDSNKIPFSSYINQESEITSFTFVINVAGIRYKYDLELTDKEVKFEKLVKFKDELITMGKKKMNHVVEEAILLRELNDIKVGKIKDSNLKLKKYYSVISFADSYGDEEIKPIMEFKMFSNSDLEFNYIDSNKLAEKYCKNNNLKNKIMKLLQIADTEIQDFNTINETREEIEKRLNELKKDVDERTFNMFKKHMLDFEGDETVTEIEFLNKGDVKLNYYQQSEGTKKLFEISEDLYYIIENGGIFIYDELDSKLHFKIIEYLIKQFNNSLEAQIICTSHNPTTINNFTKETLWFVEKREGISDLYSADDFEDLNDESNLNLIYKNGGFGAVPRDFY